MNRHSLILRALAVLVPLLATVVLYGLFRTYPSWVPQVFPFVFWPLLIVVLVLLVLYLIDTKRSKSDPWFFVFLLVIAVALGLGYFLNGQLHH